MKSHKSAAQPFTPPRSNAAPAPNPTQFIFGRKSLLDPKSMAYSKSYAAAALMFISTVYRFGLRLPIDPTREDDQIIGPTYKPRVYEPNPITPTDPITYDRQRGHLLFDAPSVAAYTGFFAQYGSPVRFKSGVTLKDVRITNHPGIARPVADDEKYVEFSLVSLDGLPLDKTKHALISAVSANFNSGFKLSLDKLTQEFGWFRNLGATAARGTLPVLVARVSATIEAPMLKGMTYILRDWHFKPIATGAIDSATFAIPSDKPVLLVELHRP